MIIEVENIVFSKQTKIIDFQSEMPIDPCPRETFLLGNHTPANAFSPVVWAKQRRPSEYVTKKSNHD